MVDMKQPRYSRLCNSITIAEMIQAEQVIRSNSIFIITSKL